MPKIRQLLPYSLVVLALSLPAHASTTALQEAATRHARGDHAGARAALDDILASSEPDPASQRAALHNLAVVSASQGEIAKAITEFESVIASDPVAAAAIANIKALNAFQAAQSLGAAMGQVSETALPTLTWIDAVPESIATPTQPSTPIDDSLRLFLEDYSIALGERRTADFLGLFAPSYAPPDGRSRAAWQLDVIGNFAESAEYEPSAELINSTSLNDRLAIVAFTLHDPRTESRQTRNLLMQRDVTRKWKILSDLVS